MKSTLIKIKSFILPPFRIPRGLAVGVKGGFLSFLRGPIRRGKVGGFIAREGMSLLFVVVLLSSTLSVSFAIFTFVFGQVRLSGQINDSFIAFFAADQGIEKILYRDRILENICAVSGENCFIEGPKDAVSGGCYFVRVSKVGGETEIISVGQYYCGSNPSRVVKRGFQVNY